MDMTKQKGQSLPMVVAFIAIGTLMAIVLFNNGQLTSEKSHLANTADAAVYSGLVWQARALNFNAYTNRAMVANQVSIAQFVSLRSWTDYGAQTATNIDAIGQFTPFAPITKQVKEAAKAVDMTVGAIAEVAVPVIDTINRTLATSQEAVYLASFASTPKLVKDVVKENDNTYHSDSAYSVVSLGQNALAWKSFVEKYDDKPGIERKVKLIHESLDGFSRGRNWDFGYLPIGVVQIAKVVKEGTTELQEDDGKYAWLAKDTFSVHIKTWRCSWKGCGWKSEELPVGWGGAYASEDICDAQSASAPCKILSTNRRAENQADWTLEKINGYNGVNPYHDITDQADKDPRVQLKVEVYINDTDVRTSSKIEGLGSAEYPDNATKKLGLGKGMFRADEQNVKRQMASISVGEVYFERPEELYRDNRRVKEYGNLFNPYWHVRLIETPKVEQMAAWLIRDPGLGQAASGAVVGLNKYQTGVSNEITQLHALKTYDENMVQSLPTLRADKVAIEHKISNVDSQIQALEQDIYLTGSLGFYNSYLMNNNVSQLVDLHETRAEYRADLAEVDADINYVEHTQKNSPAFEQILSDSQLALGNGSLIFDELDSTLRASTTVASLYEDVGTYASLQSQMEQVGEKALNEAISASVMEGLESVVNSAVESILAAITGAVTGVEISPVDVDMEISQGMQALGGYLDGTEAVVNSEVNRVKAEIETEISEQVRQRDEAVLRGVESLNKSISDTAQAIADLPQNATQSQIDNLNRLLETYQKRLETAPEDIARPYNNTIAGLNQNKTTAEGWKQPETDAISAQHQQSLNSYESQIRTFMN